MDHAINRWLEELRNAPYMCAARYAATHRRSQLHAKLPAVLTRREKEHTYGGRTIEYTIRFFLANGEHMTSVAELIPDTESNHREGILRSLLHSMLRQIEGDWLRPGVIESNTARGIAESERNRL